jgi:hypothetical protein
MFKISQFKTKHKKQFRHSGLPVILATREIQSGRITTAQANSKPPISINKKLGVVAHTCHPSYARNINRRVAVQASLGKNGKTLFEK